VPQAASTMLDRINSDKNTNSLDRIWFSSLQDNWETNSGRNQSGFFESDFPGSIPFTTSFNGLTFAID